ncbi:MAG: FRG domain-containing protein [Planctomycetota bacterium]
METVHLDSWTEFPKAIAEIRADYGMRTRRIPGLEPIHLGNNILFRGHADSTWRLETTLERASTRKYTPQKYFRCVDRQINELESTTGKRWGLPSIQEIDRDIEEKQDFMRCYLPHYDLLAYLRQHGFPSPLLDWTASPYVAAYFALEGVSEAEHCSVFAFIEMPDGMKSGGDDMPNMIRTIGPYVTTDPRHFLQKSQYTISTNWDRHSKTHTFCSHHDVSEAFEEQDVLIKITIPRSDRAKALQQLDEFNINHYTLFHSEDALIHALGLRAVLVDA